AGAHAVAPDLDAHYRRYFPIVRAKCARMLADTRDAEDVAQETFVRFWRAAAAGLAPAQPGQIVAWLYRASTRVAIDRLRERDRRKHLAAAAGGGAATGIGPAESRLDARRELAWFAARVPHDEMEAILLSRIDRLTQPEVAEVLGVSERTVRRLLGRFEAR